MLPLVLAGLPLSTNAKPMPVTEKRYPRHVILGFQQGGKVYELVSEGEFQPLPDVGDHIEFHDMAGQAKEKTFHYWKKNELALTLKVQRYERTLGESEEEATEALGNPSFRTRHCYHLQSGEK